MNSEEPQRRLNGQRKALKTAPRAWLSVSPRRTRSRRCTMSLNSCGWIWRRRPSR